jgi:16S rRNA (cytidine1402-2'-O)-methyltransferase
VTDAGTPSVSDPGYRLVTAAIAAGVRVEALPGASAVLAALVASGLPMDAFVFAGFVPPKRAARQAWFATLVPERRTVVFFEAPHRVVASLSDAGRVLGARRVAVGRELTKLHETWVRGTIAEVLARLGQPRGEFTVVLEGATVDIASSSSQVTDQQLLSEFCRMTEDGAVRREALAALAKLHRLRSRDVFAAVDRARNS